MQSSPASIDDANVGEASALPGCGLERLPLPTPQPASESNESRQIRLCIAQVLMGDPIIVTPGKLKLDTIVSCACAFQTVAALRRDHTSTDHPWAQP